MIDERIAVIGPLPPPTHGMALANQEVVKKMRANGAHVDEINLAGESRLDRIVGFSRFLKSADKIRKASVVYLSISAGIGQAREILIMRMVRLVNPDAKLVIHHHSYRYIDDTSTLQRTIQRIAAEATQVTLCSNMSEEISRIYGADERNLHDISNAAYLDIAVPQTPVRRKQLTTLGFFGWITEEKGFTEALKCYQRAKQTHPDLQFLCAGPVVTDDLRELVDRTAQLDSGFKYAGVVSGDDKTEFLRSVDLLLLPTKNDAEPRVVLEAMAFGSLIATNPRGCLPDILAAASFGMVSTDPSRFETETLEFVSRFVQSNDSFAAASQDAAASFVARRDDAQTKLLALLRSLTGA